MTSLPQPTRILLQQKSHIREIAFDDANDFESPVERLRVYLPLAEVCA